MACSDYSEHQWRSSRRINKLKHSIKMAGSSPEDGPGGPCLAWAWMDVMELAGRLARQHTPEIKELLRSGGDRAKQAHTELEALAQALHHILNNPTTTTSSSSSSSDGGERGRDGAMVMEEGSEERTMEEVRCGYGGISCAMHTRCGGALCCMRVL
jgi:hypothetical protein